MRQNESEELVLKGCGSGCHMQTLHETACTVSDIIKCCVHVWVTDW